MKKLLCLPALLLIHSLHAQGLLNKLKNKVASVAEKAAPSSAPAAATVTPAGFTDPAKFGTVIKTYSKEELNTWMGGDGGNIPIYFISANAVNGDLQFLMGEYYNATYSYKNGSLQKTADKPDFNNLYKFYNGSEQDFFSSDFTQIDMNNAMMKTGSHVASGMQAGKPMQTYTFNGKTIGQFMSASLSHSFDSSVIVVAGMSMDKGVSYRMTSSNGQNIVVPVPMLGAALISPDGKSFAAIVPTANGIDIYPSSGNKLTVGSFNRNNIWLRNSGSIFYIDAKNPKSLYKNNTLFHTFDVTELDPKKLFIGKDETNYCWMGDRALYFSDGTVFAEAKSPYRVVIDNKEVIIFLVANTQTGQVFLCKHEI